MSNTDIIIRIFIFISPFFLPWWISFIFAIAAVFYFNGYYDIVGIGFICDILYHTETTKIGLYGFTLFACIIFVLIKQIKKRLMVYEN